MYRSWWQLWGTASITFSLLVKARVGCWTSAVSTCSTWLEQGSCTAMTSKCLHTTTGQDFRHSSSSTQLQAQRSRCAACPISKVPRMVGPSLWRFLARPFIYQDVRAHFHKLSLFLTSSNILSMMMNLTNCCWSVGIKWFTRWSRQPPLQRKPIDSLILERIN